MALSGGVDSAVAAARLVDEGHEVIGATLWLWDDPDGSAARAPGDTPEHARRIAESLGIPHHVLDCRPEFAREVIEPFVEGYLTGSTPSPCAWCNRSVKLRALLRLADQLGADQVATGHYARTLTDDRGGTRLLRGRDRRKDQSYFLYLLEPGMLGRIRFPLGDDRKAQVRAEAVARGLPNAHEPESQELCFVPGGDYVAFVERHARDRLRPGKVVSHDGREIGAHAGIHRFTIGQRRGLGVALGEPAYVTAIDPERGRITLGTAAALLAGGAVLAATCWADDVCFPIDAEVQIRSQHGGARARVERETRAGSDQVRYVARFEAPVRAVCPGQRAVAFRGDRVLGGGTIVAAVPREACP
jgi:tRNA-specific 2-thiouridylase